MRIASISTFIEVIKSLPLDRDYLYVYRGHSDYVSFEMMPSVFRKLGLIQNENYLFKELLSHNPEEFRDCTFAVEFLVKMQHYGLPTRLLDLTTNPLVALYFAVSENDSVPGEVIVLRIPKKEIRYFDSDTVSVLGNLAKMDSSFEYSKLDHIKDQDSRTREFNEQEYISLLHHQIGFEKPHFKKCIFPDGIDKVVCVKPKLNNPRIVNQSGLFLLFGAGETKVHAPTIDPSWYVHMMANEMLIIQNKKKILKELELFGITSSYVYPELDKYAAKISSEIFEF